MRLSTYIVAVLFGVLAFLVAGAAAGPVSVPMHGNWCGPGHPSNIHAEPPTVDALDACCRVHDWCYENNGYLNAACDASAAACATDVANSGSASPELKAKAASVAVAFVATQASVVHQVVRVANHVRKLFKW